MQPVLVGVGAGQTFDSDLLCLLFFIIGFGLGFNDKFSRVASLLGNKNKLNVIFTTLLELEAMVSWWIPNLVESRCFDLALLFEGDIKTKGAKN